MQLRAVHLKLRAFFSLGSALALALSSGAAPHAAVAQQGGSGDAARGLAIVRHTRDSLPRAVGAALSCTSCHLADGTRAGALPWTGVAARYPQYRARSGKVDALEDRVNDCLLRSLNGRAIADTSRAMRDVVAYMELLSRAARAAHDTATRAATPAAEWLRRTPDRAHGARVFASQCTRCHGANGAGVAAVPPLWGARSFNVGAGMARLRTMAAFVRANMPYDRPGTLAERDALDVAAWVTSRPRPDFAGKEHDWPSGGAPPDAPYRGGVPRAARR